MDYLNYIIYTIKKALHAAELKWLFTFLLGVMSFFFDPTHNIAVIALFFLICIDFAFGVAAARATGEKVRSAKVMRTAIKMTVYFTLIAAARVTEYALPLKFLDETVLGFLAATELLSILENAGRMGFAVPAKLVEILGDYVSSKGGSRPPKPDEPRTKTPSQ